MLEKAFEGPFTSRKPTALGDIGDSWRFLLDGFAGVLSPAGGGCGCSCPALSLDELELVAEWSGGFLLLAGVCRRCCCCSCCFSVCFMLLRLSIECHRLSRRELSRRIALALLCSTGPVMRFRAASAPLLLELSVRLLARASLSFLLLSRPRFSAFTSSTDLRNLFSCSSGDILPRNCRLASLAGGVCCCWPGVGAVLAAALFCAAVDTPAAIGGLAATGGPGAASLFLLLFSVLRLSCSWPCDVLRFTMEVYLGEGCGRCCPCHAYCPARVGDLWRLSMLACLDSVLCLLLPSPPAPPPPRLPLTSSALLGGSVASAMVSDLLVSMRA